MYKAKSKKVNRKETVKERDARYLKKELREREVNKNALFKFLKSNPGATLNELYDNSSILYEYEFLRTMVALFEEEGIVSDFGCYYADQGVLEDALSRECD